VKYSSHTFPSPFIPVGVTNSLKPQSQPLLIYSLVADRLENAISGRKFDSSRVRSNRERYIKLHKGIDYFHQIEADPFTRLLPWQKIKDYSKIKAGHEWVWLLDSDAFIMNAEISGLAVIRFHLAKEAKISPRKIDIILCKDMNGINTGSLFIRSSEWTDTFINRWVSYENDTTIHNHHIWWEQAAFIQMYQRDELNLRSHVLIIEQRKINSYPGAYRDGDFVLHGAGFGYARLAKFFVDRGLTEV
jgi:hypothetical protein